MVWNVQLNDDLRDQVFAAAAKRGKVTGHQRTNFVRQLVLAGLTVAASNDDELDSIAPSGDEVSYE